MPIPPLFNYHTDIFSWAQITQPGGIRKDEIIAARLSDGNPSGISSI
jgi:hypothetical protein